jgi:hypothetical protein
MTSHSGQLQTLSIGSTDPLFIAATWSTPQRPFVVFFAVLCLSGALISSERYHSALVTGWAFAYLLNLTLFQQPIS